MPNLTGATGEVIINESVYIMSPLTDKDIGELNVWLRGKMIAATRASIPEDIPQREEDAIMSQAMRSAIQLDWMADPRVMAAPENLLRMLWQLMRKEQPDLTSEEFSRELLEDVDALKRCRDTFRVLHPLLSGDEEDLVKKPQGAGMPKLTTEQRSTRRSSKKQARKNRKKNRK